MKQEITAYEQVTLARSSGRKNIHEYIQGLFDDFLELHGDRLYREDPSIVGGIALFHGLPVTVIGHKKGKNTEENIACNFGMTSPEGYRKARRLMEQAERFHRPIITFVDTPGAYPGIEAESNGQSNAIAENIAYMSRIKVPVINVITGEGSSGGALAIGVADSVWMLEHSVYSILSPEGFATILWKDRTRAKEACDLMKITAKELHEFGLISGVISEEGDLLQNLDRMLRSELKRLLAKKPEELVKERYEYYRGIDGIR